MGILEGFSIFLEGTRKKDRKVQYMAMAFSILSIGPVIFGSVENLIAFLQRKRLLATNKTCPSCGSAMTLQRRSDTEDKQVRQYNYYKK